MNRIFRRSWLKSLLAMVLRKTRQKRLSKSKTGQGGWVPEVRGGKDLTNKKANFFPI
jgi:hypothetical protein